MQLSFKNDPSIKSALIARMDAHAAADEIVKGVGWRNGKGCFVGCSLDSYDHTRWPEELGLPKWLARLADDTFEGLPNADAMAFATELLRRIPVGVDLEPVLRQITIARIDRTLTAQRNALSANPPPPANVQAIIWQTVVALAAARTRCDDSGWLLTVWSARACVAVRTLLEAAAAREAARAEVRQQERDALYDAVQEEEEEEEAAAWEAVQEAGREAAQAEAAQAEAAQAEAWQQERDALYDALAETETVAAWEEEATPSIEAAP